MMKTRRTASSVPFVDVAKQNEGLSQDIELAIAEVLASGVFVNGPHVGLFEKEWAEYVGVDYAIAVNSGFDALALILHAYGIGEDDEVIVPANSYAASAMAVNAVGATPRFVDVDPSSRCVDVTKLKEVLNSDTVAVMPVHLTGNPANMDDVLDFAHENGLIVVEDACQAHGARYGGRRVGSIGDAGAFSFYPSKNLGALGDAGVITTNDATVADRLYKVRNQGQLEKYHHDVVGFNSRMDEMQAAVLHVKFPYLEEWNVRRNQISFMYDDRLWLIQRKNGPEVFTVPSLYMGAVWHLFVVETNRRDELQAHLRKNGVQTGVHYPTPIHLLPAYDFMGYRPGDFPVSERQSARGLSLPMFPEMTEDQIEYVCETIKEFFS